MDTYGERRIKQKRREEVSQITKGEGSLSLNQDSRCPRAKIGLPSSAVERTK